MCTLGEKIPRRYHFALVGRDGLHWKRNFGDGEGEHIGNSTHTYDHPEMGISERVLNNVVCVIQLSFPAAAAPRHSLLGWREVGRNKLSSSLQYPKTCCFRYVSSFSSPWNSVCVRDLSHEWTFKHTITFYGLCRYENSGDGAVLGGPVGMGNIFARMTVAKSLLSLRSKELRSFRMERKHKPEKCACVCAFGFIFLLGSVGYSHGLLASYASTYRKGWGERYLFTSCEASLSFGFFLAGITFPFFHMSNDEKRRVKKSSACKWWC